MNQEVTDFNTGVVLNDKELASVLATLRVIQDRPQLMKGIPHFNDIGEPLNEDEIDDLYERLN